MPRFVILEHELEQASHYDLMFEVGDTLRTWSLAEPPGANCETPCKALPDHRLAYLDHQGPISGGRGSVARWDQGVCQIEEQTATRWAFALQGSRLAGRATFVQQAANAALWTFFFTPSR